MLQQVALSFLAGLGVSHQLFYYIKLMITWEDYLLRFTGNLLAIHQFYFGFYLQTDVSLQQRQQHISTQHLLPEIRCGITIRILRIAAITYISCTIATLIEWQEESLFALQTGGHHNLFKVDTKVCQYAVVELE